jgi:hypothetical protein
MDRYTEEELESAYGFKQSKDQARDIDASLLTESLRMSPWERMQANDDALNFAESLRAAMDRRNAEP